MLIIYLDPKDSDIINKPVIIKLIQNILLPKDKQNISGMAIVFL